MNEFWHGTRVRVAMLRQFKLEERRVSASQGEDELA
jgi:hypothetical protein